MEFNYKVIDSNGDIKQGKMSAATEKDIVEKMQQQGMSILLIKPVNIFSLQRFWLSHNVIGQSHIALFTQQLATMLNAGLPLERALQLLIKLTHHSRLKIHLQNILAEVRDGTPLSTAIQSRSGMASKLYISMIRAGETGGALGKTLLSLGDYLNRAEEIKSSIVSALIYPIILLIMAMLSVVVLLTLVVPSFAPMFEELGGNMPLVTQIVLGAGAFLQHYWWLLVLILIIVLLLSQNLLAQSDKRLVFDRWLLYRPKLGSLLIKMDTARFSRTLSALLINGVPILNGLNLASEVVNNTAFSEAIKKIIADVKTGRSLADAIGEIGYFPEMALQMLIVGEETGQVDSILLKIANTYDKEVKVSIDRLLSLLVPIMILILSTVIAVIVISILLAILSVNEFFV
jgi:general secretion pathway protein F